MVQTADSESDKQAVRCRGIVVFNANFVPHSAGGPFLYGVVPYALRVASVLAGHCAFCGFLLYQRDDALEAPTLERCQVLDYTAVKVKMHFGMPPRVVARAIEKGTRLLLETGGARCGRLSKPLLYFQTNILLPYLPNNMAALVTHHGPFADDLAKVMGRELAVAAYANGESKYRFLVESQRAGLRCLADNSHVWAAEISFVQRRLLAEHGVPRCRIADLPPPLHGDLEHRGWVTDPELAGLREFIVGNRNAVPLITAAARLDEFKNADLLVDATIELLRRGRNFCTVIVGGPPDDPDRRALMRSVPSDFRERFLFVPKVSNPALRGMFMLLKSRGIFVCTSRYETCGFTPLEAAGLGMYILVPDRLRHVDLSNRFPVDNRFDPTVKGLTEKLSVMEKNRRLIRATDELSTAICSQTHIEAFGIRLMEVWDMISASVAQTPSEGHGGSPGEAPL